MELLSNEVGNITNAGEIIASEQLIDDIEINKFQTINEEVSDTINIVTDFQINESQLLNKDVQLKDEEYNLIQTAILSDLPKDLSDDVEQFKFDMKKFGLIETDLSDEEILQGFLGSSFKSIGLITQHLDIESREKFDQLKEKIQEYLNETSMYKWSSNQEIEGFRYNLSLQDAIVDIDDDGLMDAFNLNEKPISESSISSASSDEEIENGNDTFFQLQPTSDFQQFSYGFDRKCKENMVDIDEYLKRLIILPEIQNLTENCFKLHKTLSFMSLISKNLKSYTKQRLVVSLHNALNWGLKVFLKEAGNYIFCGNSIFLSGFGNQIKVHFGKKFGKKDEALAIASKKGKDLTYVTNALNTLPDGHWVLANCRQQEFNKFLSREEFSTKFNEIGPLTRLLNSFFPQIPEVEMMETDFQYF